MTTYANFVVVIPSPEARRNLMRLAQRMIRTFCINMSTSGEQSWTSLSDSSDDSVRITTRKVLELGQPNGLILAAASTTWLPYPHYQVFDLLKDERCRSQVRLNQALLRYLCCLWRALLNQWKHKLLMINDFSSMCFQMGILCTRSLT